MIHSALSLSTRRACRFGLKGSRVSLVVADVVWLDAGRTTHDRIRMRATSVA